MDFKTGPWLKKYISELKDNLEKSKNKQLHQSIIKAIDRVLIDPTDPEFSKHTVEPYKAVDVLGQVRLFFKIENAHDLVYFVWVNDPLEFPHDSSKGIHDKCYKEFKRLKDNQKLDIYIPEPLEEPKFHLHGKFRVDENFHASLTTASQYAGSMLKINKVDNNEYELEHIHENDYFSDALPLLLKYICEKAIEENIKLRCIVDKIMDEEFIYSVTNALTNNNFTCIDDNELYSEFLFDGN